MVTKLPSPNYLKPGLPEAYASSQLLRSPFFISTIKVLYTSPHPMIHPSIHPIHYHIAATVLYPSELAISFGIELHWSMLKKGLLLGPSEIWRQEKGGLSVKRQLPRKGRNRLAFALLLYSNTTLLFQCEAQILALQFNLQILE